MGARSSKEEEEKDGGGQWAVGTEMYRLQAAPTSSRACCDMHEVVVTLCCRDDKRPVREQMRSHSKTIEGLMLSPKEAQVVAHTA
jgi:DNA-binding FadR family transcriptional regulator